MKDDLVIKIISSKLSNKNYKAISKSLGVDVENVYAAIEIISSFNPKPGLYFNNELTEYIILDIYVYLRNNNFAVTLNKKELPKLSINSSYRKAIFNIVYDTSTKRCLHEQMNSTA